MHLQQLLKLWDQLLTKLEPPSPKSNPQPQQPRFLPQTKVMVQDQSGQWTTLQLPTRHLEQALEFLTNEQDHPPQELNYLTQAEWVLVDHLLTSLEHEKARSSLQ